MLPSRRLVDQVTHLQIIPTQIPQVANRRVQSLGERSADERRERAEFVLLVGSDVDS